MFFSGRSRAAKLVHSPPGDRLAGMNLGSASLSPGTPSASAAGMIGMPADWAKPMVDPAAFAEEQSRLAQVWTFLGFASEAADDGDWFRARLATRSVFVQRDGEVLRGFENLCLHRFHPLRTGDRGHGPIVCGFHHWRYDAQGRLAGAPKCEQMFGAPAGALGVRLNPIEIATCGDFVFGRFAGGRISLEDWLGEGFPILQAMSRPGAGGPGPNGGWKPYGMAFAANWRLRMHVSLEDYHIVAVHPRTFGRDGYQNRGDMGYFRFGAGGAHSARIGPTAADAFSQVARACEAGTWRSEHYRVFQIFPNLVVAHFHGYDQHWYVAIEQFDPLAPGRTQLRGWLAAAPFEPARPRPAHYRWTEPAITPLRHHLVLRAAHQIGHEDNAACERVQTAASQAQAAPMLGALEERIGWFEQTYRAAMAGALGS